MTYLSVADTFTAKRRKATTSCVTLYYPTLWREEGKLVNYKFIFQYLHFSIVRLWRAGWPQAGSPVSVSIKIFRWVGKKIKDHLWTGLKTYRVVQKIISEFYLKYIFNISIMLKYKVDTEWWCYIAIVSILNYYYIAISDWFYVILSDIFSSY